MNTTKFDPINQMFTILSALRQEFSGVQMNSGNAQFIIQFRSIAFTFVISDDKLTLCSRNWNCGSHWQQELLEESYCTYEQTKCLLNKLQSEFRFETNIVEVA